MRNTLLGLLIVCSWVAVSHVVRGDEFTYVDQAGLPQTVSGTLIASGRGTHVVGRADGQYVLIPQHRLQSRDVQPAPVPISPEDMAQTLRDQFGSDRIRIHVEAPYVVGLVLAGPLENSANSKVDPFLRKGARFLKNVETVFSRFCRELRLETVRPEYPQVLLIFEIDRDFDAYAESVTGGEGLAAENLAGFYSPLSNWLAIRIGECRTYQVPLHEAIHQQVYNRGLLQRLAGVPVWFNEGIATGFENDGERINVGPTLINAGYARQVEASRNLSWEETFADDTVFIGDVLSGEAYVHAWSLHWLLVTQYRREYAAYFQRLGEIAPLAQQSAAERERQFVETFGKTPSQLQADFPRLLEAGMKGQHIPAEAPTAPQNISHGDASEIELTSIRRVGEQRLIEVRGELKNTSPFRDFAYYITVQNDGGLYADWHFPSVASLSTQRLNVRLLDKPIDGSPAKPGSHVWFDVQCALPNSPEAEAWRRGEFPPPRWKP